MFFIDALTATELENNGLFPRDGWASFIMFGTSSNLDGEDGYLVERRRLDCESVRRSLPGDASVDTVQVPNHPQGLEHLSVRRNRTIGSAPDTTPGSRNSPQNDVTPQDEPLQDGSRSSRTATGPSRVQHFTKTPLNLDRFLLSAGHSFEFLVEMLPNDAIPYTCHPARETPNVTGCISDVPHFSTDRPRIVFGAVPDEADAVRDDTTGIVYPDPAPREAFTHDGVPVAHAEGNFLFVYDRHSPAIAGEAIKIWLAAVLPEFISTDLPQVNHGSFLGSCIRRFQSQRHRLSLIDPDRNAAVAEDLRRIEAELKDVLSTDSGAPLRAADTIMSRYTISPLRNHDEIFGVRIFLPVSTRVRDPYGDGTIDLPTTEVRVKFRSLKVLQNMPDLPVPSVVFDSRNDSNHKHPRVVGNIPADPQIAEAVMENAAVGDIEEALSLLSNYLSDVAADDPDAEMIHALASPVPDECHGEEDPA